LKNRPDSEIDCSAIPPLTDEQFAAAFQPNRQLIAVRLDRRLVLLSSRLAARIRTWSFNSHQQHSARCYGKRRFILAQKAHYTAAAPAASENGALEEPKSKRRIFM
jgi:hypothetical protein